MELTISKSEQLAFAIELIKNGFPVFDIEYAKTAAKKMEEQAHRQESMAVLNPTYSLDANYLLLKQADALQSIIKTIELLKECEDLKKKVKQANEVRHQINALFL